MVPILRLVTPLTRSIVRYAKLETRRVRCWRQGYQSGTPRLGHWRCRQGGADERHHIRRWHRIHLPAEECRSAFKNPFQQWTDPHDYQLEHTTETGTNHLTSAIQSHCASPVRSSVSTSLRLCVKSAIRAHSHDPRVEKCKRLTSYFPSFPKAFFDSAYGPDLWSHRRAIDGDV